MDNHLPDIGLSHKQFLKIDRDYQKAAKVADLIYVNDRLPGIVRIRKGNGFSYRLENKLIKTPEVLQRIKKLAIPPAWTQVWICPVENGHIQATGLDMRKRKQYRYHASWHALRHETKYHRLLEFGKALPQLRLRVEQDLNKRELSQERVLALAISIMERTYIRIGNSGYEKLYGSYGLTTMKDKHVEINGSEVKFCFKGKKGIDHEVTLKSRRLARVIKACRDIPGKELFQYVTENGERRSIDSGLVNAYIKEATGMDFTAKDFRTWAGSLNILWAFKAIGEATTVTECKKNVIEALDAVSKKLGNTRTVCKKYYVHPGLIRLYEEQSLKRYIQHLDDIEQDDQVSGLTKSEEVLMKILGAIT
jgi:DNA topoisomerase I